MREDGLRDESIDVYRARVCVIIDRNDRLFIKRWC